MTLIDDSVIETRELPASVDILVIGAGPTGLGAASRLTQLKYDSWIMVEASLEAGGLARTERTPEGFYFDMGGHVTFSHFAYFDDLLEAAVGKGEKHWNVIPRKSYVWVKNTYVPYPFQNNIYCLPEDDKLRCLYGVLDTITHDPDTKPPKTFDEWILRNMGEGIADLFMRPYNFKVWAYPTTVMQCEWLGDRVAKVDAKRVLRNVILKTADEGWGPNAVFKFPKTGGTGSIWKSVAYNLIPRENQHYGLKLMSIDFESKVAHFSNGKIIKYNSMINTTPLDITLRLFQQDEIASKLRYSSTHIVGIGIRGECSLQEKCWMYYPEDNCPFYRANVYSLYSDSNCPTEDTLLRTVRYADGRSVEECDSAPRTGPYWSLMFEVSESAEFKFVNSTTIVDEVIRGAIATHLLDGSEQIVSVYYTRLERGYPTPHLDRDENVKKGLDILQSVGIWNRGRFGAWKYEVGNQDHSVMQGVEAVDNILNGRPEETLNDPNLVNGRHNAEPRFNLPSAC